MVNLVVMHSDSATLVIHLSVGEYVVGRAFDCGIILAHRSISRRHAILTLTIDAIQIQDLGSCNGTFVDERRVESCRVAEGQFVRFGALRCILRRPETDGASAEFDETDRCPADKVPSPWNTDTLTPGQNRVLAELLKGGKECQIAKHLHLSVHTVHTHVRAIYKVLGVNSRAELLAKGLSPRVNALHVAAKLGPAG